jgi:hypothetical protein
MTDQSEIHRGHNPLPPRMNTPDEERGNNPIVPAPVIPQPEPTPENNPLPPPPDPEP